SPGLRGTSTRMRTPCMAVESAAIRASGGACAGAGAGVARGGAVKGFAAGGCGRGCAVSSLGAGGGRGSCTTRMRRSSFFGSGGAFHVETVRAGGRCAGLLRRRRQPEQQELRRKKLRHHHQRKQREGELLLGEEPVDQCFHLVESAGPSTPDHGFASSGTGVSCSAQAGKTAEPGRRSSRASSRR